MGKIILQCIPNLHFLMDSYFYREIVVRVACLDPLDLLVLLEPLEVLVPLARLVTVERVYVLPAYDKCKMYTKMKSNV